MVGLAGGTGFGVRGNVTRKKKRDFQKISAGEIGVLRIFFGETNVSGRIPGSYRRGAGQTGPFPRRMRSTEM
mgnify:CR=1 FL=1